MVTYIKLIAPVMVQRKQAGIAKNLQRKEGASQADGKAVSMVTYNK